METFETGSGQPFRIGDSAVLFPPILSVRRPFYKGVRVVRYSKGRVIVIIRYSSYQRKTAFSIIK